MSLQIENLSVYSHKVPLVRDVSLRLSAGKVYSVIGPNGAGKSSLLKTLANELPLTRGRILLDGRPLASIEPVRLARAMAVLPQFSRLNFPFTVAEVVGLARTPHASGAQADARIVDEALAALDIQYLKQRLYTELSGGEKQRTHIARVLAQIWRAEDSPGLPRMLLLDEPTAFLDLGHQQQLMQLIGEFKARAVTVLMVMHDINLAAGFSDEIIAMQCGEVVCQGPPETVLTAAVIEQLFTAKIDVLSQPGRGVLYSLQR